MVILFTSINQTITKVKILFDLPYLWIQILRMRKVYTNHSLISYNTFHVNSNAGFFSEPSDITELKEIVNYAGDRDLETLVIGEGSNLLFRNDFEGLVIHPAIKGIKVLEESESEILLRVGAGENWDHLVFYCVEHHWHGLENLSLIPGSVGSAPVQNIGAYGREVGEFIEYVELLDTKSGEISVMSNTACEFGYRDSIFKHGESNRYIVSHVVFRLLKSSEFSLDYGNVKEEFLKRSRQDLANLRETIIQIRKQKLPDYREYGNAGSFFKNPIVSSDQFRVLQADHEKIPHYPAGETRMKIPAAWLIDKCGWKGHREGDVGCWPKQALVLINYGNATGEQIYRLSEEIADSVSKEFGIRLEREVRVI
jgi:UDP-N-acetylmuramate dehydrogenase